MKIARDLQVVSGQTGPTIATSDLAAQKTIIATNILGTIHIEASADGVNFFAVAAMNPSNVERPIFLVTPHMRVAAASGGASSVIVVGEEGFVRAAVVPPPPLYGRGASIDISHFGTLTTLYVGTHAEAFPRWAAIKVQVSADNVHWVTFDSFNTSGCTTREMSACFVRAVGSGATGSIAIASNEPGETAYAPALALVFRPEGVARGSVYTSWSGLVASISSVQGRTILQAGLRCFFLLYRGHPEQRLPGIS